MLTVSSLQDSRLVGSLLGGGLAVLPTDTVYGLAVRASNPVAVSGLYRLKQRQAKPGTIITASIEQLVDVGLKRRYLTAVEHLWPGAISVVVPSEPALAYLDLGVGTLAVRVVADASLLKLLQKTGPLLTSSANPPGQPPATSVVEAQQYFGDSVSCYVDGSDLSGRQPSTVIRIVDDAIEILRPGAVKIDEKGRIIK